MNISYMIKQEFKCECGCKMKLFIADFHHDQVEISVGEDRRKRWDGVVIKIEDLNKFLEQFKGVK